MWVYTRPRHEHDPRFLSTWITTLPSRSINSGSGSLWTPAPAATPQRWPPPVRRKRRRDWYSRSSTLWRPGRPLWISAPASSEERAIVSPLQGNFCLETVSGLLGAGDSILSLCFPHTLFGNRGGNPGGEWAKRAYESTLDRREPAAADHAVGTGTDRAAPARRNRIDARTRRRLARGVGRRRDR